MSWVKQAIRDHRGAVAEEIYGDIIVEQTILPINAGTRAKRSFLFLKDKTALRRKEQELMVKTPLLKRFTIASKIICKP